MHSGHRSQFPTGRVVATWWCSFGRKPKQTRMKYSTRRRGLSTCRRSLGQKNVCCLLVVCAQPVRAVTYATTAPTKDGKPPKYSYSKRGSSCNWIEDRVTWKEELQYKKAMGYL